MLVVWEGNFDGRGNNALVGAEAAAPLFFNIIDSVNASYPACGNRSTRSPTAAAGGHLPRQRRSADAVVPAEGQDRFIPGKSPIKVDSVYRPVVLDIHSGEVVCPPYDAAQTRTEIFEFWPSDLANVFAVPGCRSGAAGQPLQGQRRRRRRQRAAHHFATEKYHLYPAPIAAGAG